MNTRSILTLFLRGVNTSELMTGYLEGKYNSLSLKDIKKKDIAILPGIKIESDFSDNEMDRLHSFKNECNRFIVIAYNNFTPFYNYYNLKTNETLDERKNLSCMWCRRLIKGPIVNIPIKATLHDILLPDDYDGSEDFDLVIEINNTMHLLSSLFTTNNKKITKIEIYSVVDFCCSFNCALAHAIQSRLTDNLYYNSEKLLRKLFSDIYPEKKIIKAKPWKLLSTNGGSLTEAEYDDERYYYKNINNIIMLPIKIGYMRIAE